MNQNYNYKENFWIPGEENKKLYGHLKFKNGIGYLELFDSFDKEPNRVGSNPRRSIPVLVGYLVPGRKYLKIKSASFRDLSIYF